MVLGLTGCFGSGKSTVLSMFRRLGARSADADAIARRLLEPGSPGYPRAVRLLGRAVVRSNGRLDRAAIARRVFREPRLRRRLEGIIHPLVVRQFRRDIRRQKKGVLVLDIPLLFEARLRSLVDAVVCVWAPRAARFRRLRRQGRFADDDIRRRLAAQMSLEEKRRRSEFVVDNAGSRAATRRRVRALWRELTDSLRARKTPRRNPAAGRGDLRRRARFLSEKEAKPPLTKARA